MGRLSVKGLVNELRRRHTFRTAGLYIVGAWLIMQAADVFFPAWGLPDAAINVLLATAILGFPLALVFGWFYDITSDGIARTPPADNTDEQVALPLQRRDYVLLGTLGLIAAFIVYDGVQDIVRAPRVAPIPQIVDAELPEKPEHSIAVLPFANMSSDPQNEYIADGLSEEILHRLMGYPELYVIGRTSSFAFKNSDYGIPRISALLGVRHLLQGSARKQGNRLRITVQLVDEDGAQQWSEVFDRSFEDVFAIQEEIAGVVAQTIVPRVVAASRSAHEPDLEAYQHYLLGREYLHHRDVSAAEKELAKAIELDRSFAEAYAEYAIALSLFTNDTERLRQAEQSVERALELRPGLPRARAARGLLQWMKGAMPEAEETLQRVLVDEPDIDAINWLAGVLNLQGKHEEADAVTERGFRLDPLNPIIGSNLAEGYRHRGETAKAERILLRLDQLPQSHFYVVDSLVSLYRQTGRLVEMDRHIRRFIIDGEFSDVPVYRVYRQMLVAESRALLNQWEQVRSLADEAGAITPDPNSLEETWARPHYQPLMWQGRYGAAVDALDRAASSIYGSVSRLPLELVLELGTLHALAGNHERAVRLLEPALPGDWHRDPEEAFNAAHALAWSYRQTGETEKLRMLLEPFDLRAQELEAQGLLNRSHDLYQHAQVRLQLGDREGALDRLEQAVDAGWSEYYLHHKDPRWNPLIEDPRYQALMQGVKRNVDAQRAKIEPIVTADQVMDRFEVARRPQR
jgi:TolB-like protein